MSLPYYNNHTYGRHIALSNITPVVIVDPDTGDIATLGSLPFGADYLIQSNADGGGNYQTITYKSGGASGTIVKVVTLTFDANGSVVTYLES